MIMGPKAAGLFEDELNISLQGEAAESVNGLEYNGWLASIRSLYQKVEIKNGVQPFGKLYSDNDLSGPAEIAASINTYGKGRIAATYLNLGERYNDGASTVSRDFLNALVRELFPEPIVEVTGSHFVDVTVNRIHGKLTVNLVNTSGPHDNPNIKVFDEISPVGPLQISIMSAKKPERVMLEPAGKEMSYDYKNGKIELTLSKLEIHDIIVVE